MKTLVNLTAMVLVIALLVGLGYGVFWSYGHFGEVYGILQPAQKIILFTALLGGLFCVLILVGGIRSAARIGAQGRLLDRKVDLYRNLLSGYGSLLASNRRLDSRLDQAADAIESLGFELTLIAGSKVIAANERLQKVVQLDQSEAGMVEEARLALVAAMRRELGHGSDGDETRLLEQFGQTQRTGRVAL